MSGRAVLWFEDLIETAWRLLTSDLPDAPLIVPVGLNSVGLNIKEGFQVSLLEQTTWPTLWGCQSYDFDKIQDTLVDNNIEYMEKENRLSINLGLGSASFPINLPNGSIRILRKNIYRILMWTQ